jgi:lipoprotein-anchoring transpeptidase ErfK/SrfK
MKKYYFLSLVLAGAFLVPMIGFASDSRSPEVKLLANNLDYKRSFMAFDGINQNGGTIAMGDVNKDGKAEIVMGTGPGDESWVFIYDSKGNLLNSFLAYDRAYTMGINVAVGNVRKEKGKKKKQKDEIIVAPMFGGGPQVRVFDENGNALADGTFYAFARDFKGGVYLAACDIDGNGKDEVVTSAGRGGSPHVRLYDGRGNYLGIDYRPFDEIERGGVSIACANVDGGKEDEIVMALASFGPPQVKVYKTDAEQTILGDFYAYARTFYGGVQVTGVDVDNDKRDEIVTAPNWDGGPQLRVFEAYGKELQSSFVYEEDFRGGLRLTSGKFKKKSINPRIIVFPAKRTLEGRSDLFKYIDVNLSEQKLRAYENGIKQFDFYISSGKSGYATPTGEFTIYAKMESTRMTGFYGEGNPNNYDLANVPHVLAFYGDFTIHGAYWHNNWGHVMSHGCVNEPLYEAGLLYDWSDIGDPVIVHY